MSHVLKMTNAQTLINLNLETWQLIKLCWLRKLKQNIWRLESPTAPIHFPEIQTPQISDSPLTCVPPRGSLVNYGYSPSLVDSVTLDY